MQCLKIRLSFLTVSLFLLGCPFFEVQAENLSGRLSGRILLQVEAAGEAWYLNPVDQRRYYLGRPDDAFALMRRLGLGINEQDYKEFWRDGAKNLKGRILLRVQAAGEAYYVNPVDSRLYYLGRPSDAFALMRSLGLGISNSDLNSIVTANEPLAVNDEKLSHAYTWFYKNKPYDLQFSLSADLFKSYNTSAKVYTYYVDQPPVDIRESFYGLFLQTRPEDKQTEALLTALRRKAAALNLDADETAAFILSFIQYLPYDQAKISLKESTPYYPFETLYLQKGVCADKTFLAVMWLRRLGYGAAILDFPDSNHSAAGIACPVSESLAGSGYCYIETTNYFPVGVVPSTIANGQADNKLSDLEVLFNADRLGRMEIKQKSQGRIYQGVAAIKAEISGLKEAQVQLSIDKENLNKKQMAVTAAYDALKKQEGELLSYKNNGDIAAYNNLVPTYNQAVIAYQLQSDNYNNDVKSYNAAVQAFNQRQQLFYQQ